MSGPSTVTSASSATAPPFGACAPPPSWLPACGPRCQGGQLGPASAGDGASSLTAGTGDGASSLTAGAAPRTMRTPCPATRVGARSGGTGDRRQPRPCGVSRHGALSPAAAGVRQRLVADGGWVGAGARRHGRGRGRCGHRRAGGRALRLRLLLRHRGRRGAWRPLPVRRGRRCRWSGPGGGTGTVGRDRAAPGGASLRRRGDRAGVARQRSRTRPVGRRRRPRHHDHRHRVRPPPPALRTLVEYRPDVRVALDHCGFPT